MKIYAIGDMHFSFSRPVDPLRWDDVETYKPMDIFGAEWRGHYRKIYDNWVKIINNEDIVLIPGDFSWAMKLSEARYDLDFLGLLPGTIVGIPGNHDLWWQSLSRVREALPPNMRLLQNDHTEVGNVSLCGSRGWLCPGAEYFSDHDLKIYRRELIRMENSLKSAGPAGKEIIVMMHFMPVNDRHEKNEFIEMFQYYRVNTVVYGHLHGAATRLRLPGRAWGIKFQLASADFLHFAPVLIKDEGLI
ncbi:Calcineurin-like phosphoesterase [Pelotomaculum schinkii]|uniref:Calcineurin-like phosphoesterase n=1 Tax=Pelotomaculum schinkii TaxID=78350 RepID=A0A4Y7R856_9FIRM|nr:metallophosphoesterase [Pelotomaculum schinkii]TEB04962.1 Calcineurin-like phosphoesterase [Pelotomaculum schinkii]